MRQKLEPGQGVTAEEVCLTFKRINRKKAAGPDRLTGRVLKEYREQLSFVYSHLFRISLETHYVPCAWKSLLIVPVPKTSKPQALNDYRPVAFTSIVVKCLERIVLNCVLGEVQSKLDPLQFTCIRGRGTEYALLYVLHKIYCHLDQSKRYVHAMFMDFSSAFNTIRPHILMERLSQLNVNGSVRVNSAVSFPVRTYTGAPQGGVISPVLFALYTDECRLNSSDVLIGKFADDTVIVGLIVAGEAKYCECVDEFVNWGHASFLQDFRVKIKTYTKVKRGFDCIDIVNEYKYLGKVAEKGLERSPAQRR